MFVQTEVTPNPNSLKFLPGKTVSNNGSFEVIKKEETDNELVRNILSINGVTGVFLGEDFISINKNEEVNWEDIKHIAISLINDFYSTGKEFVIANELLGEKKEEHTEIEKQIISILESKIRPAVAKDGGDIKFKDLNGDNVINALDQQIMGQGLPTFFGGLTNNMKYKNFDVSFFFQFSGGNQIYNNTRAFSEGMNGLFGQTTAVLNRWTPTNTNTNIPRAIYGDTPNNRRTSTRWLEDGDFIRLKNANIGYTFSPSLVKRLKLNSLRMYVAGQNLWTKTKYQGLDPEVSTFSDTNTAPGTDFLTFPQARTYTFGINVGF